MPQPTSSRRPAHRARLGLAPRPAESLGADAQHSRSDLLDHGRPLVRILVGVVAQAQLDRVDAELDRELVHGALDRVHAADARPGARIGVGV